MKCNVKSVLSSAEVSTKKYHFTLDWLNCRIDCPDIWAFLNDLSDVIPEIDFNDWSDRGSGVCFYSEGLYLPAAGLSSVVLAYNKDEHGRVINEPGEKLGTYGVLVSLSGDGCRYINSLHDNALFDFVHLLAKYNPVCTRIDVACDILDKENEVVPMIQDFATNCYNYDRAKYDLNCNLNRRPGWVQINRVYDKVVNDYTDNVTIGGRNSSKGTLQLYNKRVEVESGRLSELAAPMLEQYGNPEYWWRLEYRCKSFSHKVFTQLLQTGIVGAYFQAMCNFGFFVEARYEGQLDKSDTVPCWVDFLEYVENELDKNIHLVQLVSLKYIPSSIPRSMSYIERNPALLFKIYCLRFIEDLSYEVDIELLRQGFRNMLNNEARYGPFLDELACRIGATSNEEIFIKLGLGDMSFDVA